MKIVIDSNYYIGLTYKDDPLHNKILNLTAFLNTTSYIPVISNLIFLEIVTVISQRLTRADAIILGNLLKRKVEIIRIDEELEDKTWELFKTIQQKDISYVDCSTLVVLQEKKIKKLVTFDKHLQKFSKQFKFSVIS